MNKRIVGSLVAVVATVALVVGVFAVSTEAQAASCRCPLIVAPVRCDNGKTYTNQCFANCNHAKNCVRTGD